MIAEGRSINVTLIFSLSRYAEVIDAYLDGLETFVAAGGDLATVHSVASFFVSRVDTEVDDRLDAHRRDASAQTSAAAPRSRRPSSRTSCFAQRFAGDRWERLAELGAHVQRPLWASTSTKNPTYSDTLYVDSLIGPDTVNTLPEATIAAFEDHGRVARTIDTDVDDAREVMRRLAAVGHRHGRRRPHPRRPGRRQLPPVVPGRARRARRQGPPARGPVARWTGPAGRCSVCSRPRCSPPS